MICEECRVVYPGPPSQGVDCVLCKKCSGYTMPKPQAKIRDLERQLYDVTDKLKGAKAGAKFYLYKSPFDGGISVQRYSIKEATDYGGPEGEETTITSEGLFEYASNLEQQLKEAYQKGREQMAEECAKIADEHMEICDGNGCPVISEKIRQIAQRDGGIEK